MTRELVGTEEGADELVGRRKCRGASLERIVKLLLEMVDEKEQSVDSVLFPVDEGEPG